MYHYLIYTLCPWGRVKKKKYFVENYQFGKQQLVITFSYFMDLYPTGSADVPVRIYLSSNKRQHIQLKIHQKKQKPKKFTAVRPKETERK
jgi:hypothetical protein